MPELSRADRRRLAVSLTLLTLLIVGAIALAASGKLGPLLGELWRLFESRKALRDYVESWGAAAPIAFIIIQALQVLFAPIPGEFTGAVGGFIFGGLPNIFYSTIGLTLGSIGAFWASRIIGLPLVKLVVSEETMSRFDFLTRRRGFWLAFVFYVFPGFPKDILSYLLGLSPMGFLKFLAACGLGRIPGTILLSYTGSAVFDGNWLLLGIVTVICCVVMGFLYLYRDSFISRVRHGDESKSDAEAVSTD